MIGYFFSSDDDDSDEPVIQHRAPQLPPAPRYASFSANNKHLLESSESNMITAVNEILSTNSRSKYCSCNAIGHCFIQRSAVFHILLRCI